MVVGWVAPQGRGWAVLKHGRRWAPAFGGVLSGARQAPRPCGGLEHPGPGGQGCHARAASEDTSRSLLEFARIKVMWLDLLDSLVALSEHGVWLSKPEQLSTGGDGYAVNVSG